MLYKKSAIAATTSPDGSYKNLFNPISQLLGGKIDRFPKFMLSLPGLNHGTAADVRNAWLISKMGAVGLLAAAVTGVARGVQHVYQMSELSERDDPAKKIRSEVSTTFKGKLMPDKVKESKAEEKEDAKDNGLSKDAVDHYVQEADPLSIRENTLRIGLPISAALLAAALSYKNVDKMSDAYRNHKLTKAINNKRDAVRQLLLTRAKVGKGTASAQEVEDAVQRANDEDNYVKTAGLKDFFDKVHNAFKKTYVGSLNAAGLIVAGLFGASAIGAYKYFSQTDPKNIAYKAMKKGLKEYALQKSMITPITNVPEDSSEYFEAIDKGGKEKSVRELPEQQSTHRQLSVSID